MRLPGNSLMFLIHPADLERRRQSCQPVAAPIARRPKDLVRSCSACASDQSAILSPCDRYGIPIRTAMCLDCGLIYLVDRLTAGEYNRFYGSGEYREISARFHGVRHTLAHIQADQRDYARKLAASLKGLVTGGG